MKLLIEQYDQRYIIETQDDSDVYQVANLLKRLLVAAGYSAEIVDEAFEETDNMIPSETSGSICERVEPNDA